MSTDLHPVTVIYTSMGDPHVHARGCPDIARTMTTRDMQSEDMHVRDATDIAKLVYADVINEGEDPEDLASALDIKPCVTL